MKLLSLLFFVLFIFDTVDNVPAQMLKLSENKRFLIKEDGTPFFWMGDTGWEMIHKLSKQEAVYYMQNRADKGFNVIMTVILSEMNGATTPNAEGALPLIDLDPSKPNEAFFKHLDYLVNEAKKLNLYLALLPTWGAHIEDKAHPLFENIAPFTEQNAEAYGAFLGNRYQNDYNIVWIIGGDRSPIGNEKKWAALAKGIRSGGSQHLISYHPVGGETSSTSKELALLLDFNMIQSGHERIANSNYAMIKNDYDLPEVKPVMESEPNYEEAAIGFDPSNGRFTDFHVRNASYWSVFAGGFGINYGHNSIWQMYAPQKGKAVVWPLRTWKEALDAKGSGQLRHLKNLMLSRPYLNRIPDQGLTSQPQTERTNHIQITRDGTAGKKDASYIMVYYAYLNNTPIKTDCILHETLRAWWYNPRNGEAILIGELLNKGSFSIPWSKRITEDEIGPDWVLVIDDASKNYPAPGTVLE
jgi:hypothetical protein